MEGVMPFETIMYVTFVVAALGIFAAALTYAEWAAKHANDAVGEPAHAKPEIPANRQDTDARKAA
jgi:hypothetical protein